MQALVFINLFLMALVNAKFTDPIENSSTSLYYMLSRSIVLYLLLAWFAFMYLCFLNYYKIRDVERAESVNSLLIKDSRKSSQHKPPNIKSIVFQEPRSNRPIEEPNQYPRLIEVDSEYPDLLMEFRK